LDELAHDMGLASSKKDLDGSKVHEYYKKGKLKEIEKYCNADVELTRQIFKKMMFEG
jgi:predicted PolB exonuclease-like 3'-5' exonuclease